MRHDQNNPKRENKNLEFCDDRMELLDTIKEMVKNEVSKSIHYIKKVGTTKNATPETPPPEKLSQPSTFRMRLQKVLQSIFNCLLIMI